MTGIPGKSAYEIAVEHGFTGTEEEWLASLVGPQGDPGPTGPDGPQGPPGEPGPIEPNLVVSSLTAESGEFASIGSDRVVMRARHADGQGEDFMFVTHNVTDISGDPADPDDTLYAWGFNVSLDPSVETTGENPDRPSFMMQFERNFIEGDVEDLDRTDVGEPCYEWHLKALGEDGIERRPIMVTAPRAGATDPNRGAFGFIRTDNFAFVDWAGNDCWNWSLPDGTIQIKRGTLFQATVNNVPVGQQINQAGDAFLDLWKINNRDELHATASVSIEAAGTPNLAAKMAVLTIQDHDAADGGHLLYALTTASEIGTYNAFQFSCAAAALVGTIVTTKAGGIAVLRSAAPTNGHAVVAHAVTDKTYTVGVHGPADEYRIDSAGDFTSSANPDFAIVRATKQAKFGGPAKLKSFTLATMPSAAAAGGGSLIFVSDASGGACVACSDGSSWKRINLGPAVG